MVSFPKKFPHLFRELGSDFKYTKLKHNRTATPPANEWLNCSQQFRLKAMSWTMRIAAITFYVGMCVAIIVKLLFRHHIQKLSPVELPEMVEYPWRDFPVYPLR